MRPYIPHTVQVRVPQARQVSVVGDFNHWQSGADPMRKVGDDLWERIVEIPPGRQRYAFFVIDDWEAAGGAVRSRIVGNGWWVPEIGGEHQDVTAHPSLMRTRVERRVA